MCPRGPSLNIASPVGHPSQLWLLQKLMLLLEPHKRSPSLRPHLRDVEAHLKWLLLEPHKRSPLRHPPLHVVEAHLKWLRHLQ